MMRNPEPDSHEFQEYQDQLEVGKNALALLKILRKMNSGVLLTNDDAQQVGVLINEIPSSDIVAILKYRENQYSDPLIQSIFFYGDLRFAELLLIPLSAEERFSLITFRREPLGTIFRDTSITHSSNRSDKFIYEFIFSILNPAQIWDLLLTKAGRVSDSRIVVSTMMRSDDPLLLEALKETLGEAKLNKLILTKIPDDDNIVLSTFFFKLETEFPSNVRTFILDQDEDTLHRWLKTRYENVPAIIDLVEVSTSAQRALVGLLKESSPSFRSAIAREKTITGDSVFKASITAFENYVTKLETEIKRRTDSHSIQKPDEEYADKNARAATELTTLFLRSQTKDFQQQILDQDGKNSFLAALEFIDSKKIGPANEIDNVNYTELLPELVLKIAKELDGKYLADLLKKYVSTKPDASRITVLEYFELRGNTTLFFELAKLCSATDCIDLIYSKNHGGRALTTAEFEQFPSMHFSNANPELKSEYLMAYPQLIIDIIRIQNQSMLNSIFGRISQEQKDTLIINAFESINFSTTTLTDFDPIGVSYSNLIFILNNVSRESLIKIIDLVFQNSTLFIMTFESALHASTIPESRCETFFSLMSEKTRNHLIATNANFVIQKIARIKLSPELCRFLFDHLSSVALEKAIKLKLDNENNTIQLIQKHNPDFLAYLRQRLGSKVERMIVKDLNTVIRYDDKKLISFFLDASGEEIVDYLFENAQGVHPLLYGDYSFVRSLMYLIPDQETRRRLYKWNNDDCCLAHLLYSDYDKVWVLSEGLNEQNFYKSEFLRALKDYEHIVSLNPRNLCKAVFDFPIDEALKILKLPFTDTTSLLLYLSKRNSLGTWFATKMKSIDDSEISATISFLSEKVKFEEESVHRLFELEKSLPTVVFLSQIVLILANFSDEQIIQLLKIKDANNQNIFQRVLYKSKSAEYRIDILSRIAGISTLALNHCVRSRSPKGRNVLHDTLIEDPNFIKILRSSNSSHNFLFSCEHTVLMELLSEKDSKGRNFLQAVVQDCEDLEVTSLVNIIGLDFRQAILDPLATGDSLLPSLSEQKRFAIYSLLLEFELRHAIFEKKYNNKILKDLLLEKLPMDLAYLSLLLPDYNFFDLFIDESTSLKLARAISFKLALIRILKDNHRRANKKDKIRMLLMNAPFSFYKELHEHMHITNKSLFEELIETNNITFDHVLKNPEILNFDLGSQTTVLDKISTYSKVHFATVLDAADELLKTMGITNENENDVYQAGKDLNLEQIKDQVTRLLKTHQANKHSPSETSENTLYDADRDMAHAQIRKLRNAEFSIGFGRVEKSEELRNRITASRFDLDQTYLNFLVDLDLPHNAIKTAGEANTAQMTTQFFSRTQIPGILGAPNKITSLNVRDQSAVQEYLAQIGGSFADRHAIDHLIRVLFLQNSKGSFYKLESDMAPQPLLDNDWYSIAAHMVQKAVTFDANQSKKALTIEDGELIITEQDLREKVLTYIDHWLDYLLANADTFRNMQDVKDAVSSETIRAQFRMLWSKILTLYIDMYRHERINSISLKPNEIDGVVDARILDPQLPGDRYRIAHLPEIAGGELQFYPDQIVNLIKSPESLVITIGQRDEHNNLLLGYVTLQLGYIEENDTQYPAVFQNEAELAAYRSARNVHSCTMAIHNLILANFPGYRHIVKTPYEIYLKKGNGGKRVSQSVTLIGSPLEWRSNKDHSQRSPEDDELAAQLTILNSLVEIVDY
ncbi:MAG: hypothetical protein WAU07_00110 [Microgenomates group bacterium]